MSADTTREEQIDPKLVSAMEYVMNNDSVLKYWSRNNPAHFTRLIERVLEWHGLEITKAQEQLLKEWKEFFKNTDSGNTYYDFEAWADEALANLNKEGK